MLCRFVVCDRYNFRHGTAQSATVIAEMCAELLGSEIQHNRICGTVKKRQLRKKTAKFCSFLHIRPNPAVSEAEVGGSGQENLGTLIRLKKGSQQNVLQGACSRIFPPNTAHIGGKPAVSTTRFRIKYMLQVLLMDTAAEQATGHFLSGSSVPWSTELCLRWKDHPMGDKLAHIALSVHSGIRSRCPCHNSLVTGDKMLSKVCFSIWTREVLAAKTKTRYSSNRERDLQQIKEKCSTSWVPK